MDIIKHNANALLFERVRLMSEQRHDSWRCIHFNFADGESYRNPNLRSNIILNVLTEQLAGVEGTMYLCEDDDIFLLFQGRIKSVSTRLGREEGDFYTVFDLSKDMQELLATCRIKCLHMQARHRNLEFSESAQF